MSTRSPNYLLGWPFGGIEEVFRCAEGGTRTHTSLRRADFKLKKEAKLLSLLSSSTDDSSELIRRFFNSRREGLSPKTIEFYKTYLNHASSVIGRDVTGQELKQFMGSLLCSNGGKHAY
jgi:hypothetical protein